jgi:hypothetical protein
MGKWIEEAERGITCVKCKSKVAKGDRFWYHRKGVYMCELCGSMAEHEEPEVGAVEQGVLTDLAEMPDEASGTTLAQITLKMARDIDRDEIQPRDLAPYNKEMRQNIAALKELFPPAGEDDPTDIARKNRERMLGEDFEEPYTP